MTTHIIGCGGVASYFLPPFLRTLKHIADRRLRRHKIVLYDGDELEARNLQRQNFNMQHAYDARFKADSLTEELDWYPSLSAECRFISTTFAVEDGDTIMVMADNHLARKHALEAADRACRVTVLSAANSTIGAEAWWYDAATMRGTSNDPRIRFPVIETDDSDSPVHATGCTSEAKLEAVPQTPIANFMAAAHLLLLWNFVNLEKPKLDPKLTKPCWPIGFSNTATNLEKTSYTL